MPNLTLSISDLEELSGVARRTIHFYVREGLLSSPDKPGGGARYGSEHLVRLLLIRELQREHYKLNAIRERLDAELTGMTDEQMEARLAALLASGPATTAPRGTIDDLQQFLCGPGGVKTVARALQDFSKVFLENSPQQHKPFSFADLARSSAPDFPPKPAGPVRSSSRQALSGVSWTKFSLQDGIEVQIREDVLRKKRKRILAWLADHAKIYKGRDET